jgi:hypothetical protein
MNSKILILSSIACFGAGVSSAYSGPCAAEIDGLKKALASKDAGSGPTIGSGGEAQAPSANSAQHPPTAIMGQETQGKATSSEDARRQTQGRPTVAQQGAAAARSSTDKVERADVALQRARALDAQGKEAECMETVREAKEVIGAK